MSAATTDIKTNVEKDLKLEPIKILLDPPNEDLILPIQENVRDQDESSQVATKKLLQFLDPRRGLTLNAYLYFLYESVKRGRLDIVKAIFSSNPKLNNYINCFLITPENRAAEDQDGDSVLRPANHASKRYFKPLTLLGLAAYNADLKMVKFLVEKKNADPCALSRFGMTPVHEVFLGHGEVFTANWESETARHAHFEARLLVARYLSTKDVNLLALSENSEKNLYSIQAKRIKSDSDYGVPTAEAFLIAREKILCEIEKGYNEIKVFTHEAIGEIFDPYQIKIPQISELIFKHLHDDMKSKNDKSISGKFYSLMNQAAAAIHSAPFIKKIAVAAAFTVSSLGLRSLACKQLNIGSENSMCRKDDAHSIHPTSIIAAGIPVATLLFSWGAVKYNTYKENNKLRERLGTYAKKK